MSLLAHTKTKATDCLNASHNMRVALSEKLIAAETRVTKQAVSRQTQERNILYLINDTVKLK